MATHTWESHAINYSTRDVETGSDMAVQRGDYKAGGHRSLPPFNLRIYRDRRPLQSEELWRQDLVPFGLRTQ